MKKGNHNSSSSNQGKKGASNQGGSGERNAPQSSDRPVINTITGGPHPAYKSWGEMERYAHALKHAP